MSHVDTGRTHALSFSLSGTVMTPNYIDSSSLSVAPWCDCSNSGNDLEDCLKFLNFFKDNTCLSEFLKNKINANSLVFSSLSESSVCYGLPFLPSLPPFPGGWWMLASFGTLSDTAGSHTNDGLGAAKIVIPKAYEDKRVK